MHLAIKERTQALLPALVSPVLGKILFAHVAPGEKLGFKPALGPMARA